MSTHCLTRQLEKVNILLKHFETTFEGSFGEVRRAIHIKSNITRAVKIVRIESMTNEEQERVRNEINVLKTIVKQKFKFSYPHISTLGSSAYNEDYRVLSRCRVLLYCHGIL